MAKEFVLPSGSITLVAATAKVVLEVPSAGESFTVVGLEVMSAATAAGSLVVEWGTYTTTGTGTTITATPWGVDQSSVAVLGTVKKDLTTAPAGFAVGTLPNWVIPLPGMYSSWYPYPMYQPPNTLRALRVTSTLASPCRLNLYIAQ